MSRNHSVTARRAVPLRSAPAVAVTMTYIAGAAHAGIIDGPDILSTPPSSVEVVAPGHLNTGQQAFNEQQNTPLALPTAVNGGTLAAGTVVSSHMIFYHWTHTSPSGPLEDPSRVWTFDGAILGVMSDDPGSLEEASNTDCARPGTTYPAVYPTHRGFESFHTDDYTLLADNVIEVTMQSGWPGDYMRVLTAPPEPGMTFSIDFQSSSAWAGAFGEGDILTVSGPLISVPNAAQPAPGPPQTLVQAGADLGLACSPVCGPALCTREVDALSYGRDRGSGFRFSVDERATGVPGGTAPDVRSEGAAGNQEASADAFTYLGPLPAGPGTVYGNSAFIDGNAIAPSGADGVGLTEPNPWNADWHDVGDTIDAMDLNTMPGHLRGPIYFSLDGAISDPYEAGVPGCDPVSSDSAGANGFSGADILVVSSVGAPAAIWAPAAVLGLDPDDDDIDALALLEDGDGVLDPDDRVFFSVRRESIVIGQPDSRYGKPITEGDVLRPPLAGGLSPYPAVVISAEALGLRDHMFTERDELDALDKFLRYRGGDLDQDGTVGFIDLLTLLTAWGPCPPEGDCVADIDGNGTVGFLDLLRVIADWGEYLP